jgi:protein O-GlcNAc transferase
MFLLLQGSDLKYHTMSAMKNIIPEILAGLSEIPPCLAPEIMGMTSPKIRMLLNRLVARLPKDEAYFEVGCLRGATLVSALLDHPGVTAYACDNWSQFGSLDAKNHFFKNLRENKARLPKIFVYEEDCFGLPAKRPFQKPIGIFFYDGKHSYEAQVRAVTDFAPFLAESSILLVDDWNFAPAQAGTWNGLSKLRLKNLHFTELRANGGRDVANYWNGVGAFHLTR